MRLVITAAVLAGAFFFNGSIWAYPLTPQPELTPGDLCSPKDPDFSRYRYNQQIPYCQRNVDRDLKTRVYEAYNIPRRCRRDYTVDHLIPLSIGGNNSFENLWPEHRRLKATRPYLEQNVFEDVRSGQISQKEAIEVVLDEKLNPGARLLFETLKSGDCN